MTKREFRRLKAGNLVQEDVSRSLWIVVERRRWVRPCLILERARLVSFVKGAPPTHWAVPEDYSPRFERLA